MWEKLIEFLLQVLGKQLYLYYQEQPERFISDAMKSFTYCIGAITAIVAALSTLIGVCMIRLLLLGVNSNACFLMFIVCAICSFVIYNMCSSYKYLSKLA